MLVQAERGTKTSETIDFVLEECISCGTPFLIPRRLQQQLRNSREVFYCPNGHQQYYSGKTEAEKLKEKLEASEKLRLQDREEMLNKWLDEKNRANVLDKKLKRVHNGVCPCCNRSFQNLKKHIETKHPELVNKKVK